MLKPHSGVWFTVCHVIRNQVMWPSLLGYNCASFPEIILGGGRELKTLKRLKKFWWGWVKLSFELIKLERLGLSNFFASFKKAWFSNKPGPSHQHHMRLMYSKNVDPEMQNSRDMSGGVFIYSVGAFSVCKPVFAEWLRQAIVSEVCVCVSERKLEKWIPSGMAVCWQLPRSKLTETILKV